MVNLHQLAMAIDCPPLFDHRQEDAFLHRDAIKQVLSQHILQKSTDWWLEKLHLHDIWAMAVLDWKELQQHPAYRFVQMEQDVVTGEGKKFVTTRCPVRINGRRLTSEKPAPQLGEHNRSVLKEFQNSSNTTSAREFLTEAI